ncbi:MAG TPA: 2-amino-4-hydroxy-6-hydroxymethyldihydropteridine diphosphokinase [Frankiaceae bacterium]|nr:2-amino-4-hydroxy-6-hydroxymethyldihydropteridine diphosphokinase [Frankiaceae bacterium]
MSRVVLSIGANLGDRFAALQNAVDDLAEVVTVLAVSPVYETAPVGGPDQRDFLNAVVLASTDEPPAALVAFGQRVERRAGRVPSERWGPRALDVDLVAYDDVVSDDPEATVPHPRAHERAFVLRPWLDVDPAAAVPGVGPVADLLEKAVGEVRRCDEYVLRLPG